MCFGLWTSAVLCVSGKPTRHERQKKKKSAKRDVPGCRFGVLKAFSSAALSARALCPAHPTFCRYRANPNPFGATEKDVNPLGSEATWSSCSLGSLREASVSRVALQPPSSLSELLLPRRRDGGSPISYRTCLWHFGSFRVKRSPGIPVQAG